MSPNRQAESELDRLIAEITIDCYDEDEAIAAFDGWFGDSDYFPIAGTVVGESVRVLYVSLGNGRRELIATCERGGREYEIALLDIVIDAGSPIQNLVAAYCRWQGH